MRPNELMILDPNIKILTFQHLAVALNCWPKYASKLFTTYASDPWISFELQEPSNVEHFLRSCSHEVRNLILDDVVRDISTLVAAIKVSPNKTQQFLPRYNKFIWTASDLSKILKVVLVEDKKAIYERYKRLIDPINDVFALALRVEFEPERAVELLKQHKGLITDISTLQEVMRACYNHEQVNILLPDAGRFNIFSYMKQIISPIQSLDWIDNLYALAYVVKDCDAAIAEIIIKKKEALLVEPLQTDDDLKSFKRIINACRKGSELANRLVTRYLKNGNFMSGQELIYFLENYSDQFAAAFSSISLFHFFSALDNYQQLYKIYEKFPEITSAGLRKYEISFENSQYLADNKLALLIEYHVNNDRTPQAVELIEKYKHNIKTPESCLRIMYALPNKAFELLSRYNNLFHPTEINMLNKAIRICPGAAELFFLERKLQEDPIFSEILLKGLHTELLEIIVKANLNNQRLLDCLAPFYYLIENPALKVILFCCLINLNNKKQAGLESPSLTQADEQHAIQRIAPLDSEEEKHAELKSALPIHTDDKADLVVNNARQRIKSLSSMLVLAESYPYILENMLLDLCSLGVGLYEELLDKIISDTTIDIPLKANLLSQFLPDLIKLKNEFCIDIYHNFIQQMEADPAAATIFKVEFLFSTLQEDGLTFLIEKAKTSQRVQAVLAQIKICLTTELLLLTPSDTHVGPLFNDQFLKIYNLLLRMNSSLPGSSLSLLPAMSFWRSIESQKPLDDKQSALESNVFRNIDVSSILRRIGFIGNSGDEQRLAKHYLLANRHTSDEAQSIYDQQFGLVLRPKER
jgi:hypothetical protein